MQEKIENLKEKINTWNGKDIIILQKGFLESKFEIESLSYKVEYEVLKINSQNNKNYIKINLNQIYEIEIKNNEIEIYLDNDIKVNLTLKQ